MRVVRRLVLQAFVVFLSIYGLATIFLLNPQFSYAHKTQIGQVRIYHNRTLPKAFETLLIKSISLAQNSTLYDANLEIDLCFNEGNLYPKVIGYFRGGIAYSFSDKVVFNYGELDVTKNHVSCESGIEKPKYNYWKLDELMAHEITHTLQYNQNSFHALKSDTWKVEGYAEYIARADRDNFINNFEYMRAQKPVHAGGLAWLTFEDGTAIPLSYMKSWLCVQYLIDIENRTHAEVLEEKRTLKELESDICTYILKKQT